MDWVCSQEWKSIGDADTGGNRLVRSLTLAGCFFGTVDLSGLLIERVESE
jgi:hypothetical protein